MLHLQNRYLQTSTERAIINQTAGVLRPWVLQLGSPGYESWMSHAESGTSCTMTCDKLLYISTPPYPHLCARETDTSAMAPSFLILSPTAHCMAPPQVLGHFELILGYLKTLNQTHPSSPWPSSFFLSSWFQLIAKFYLFYGFLSYVYTIMGTFVLHCY